MSRHPYTHAADFVRALGPINENGVVLSRADAALIRQGIAKAIGMPDEVLAGMLSLAEQAKTAEDRDKHCQRVMKALGFR